MRRNRESLLLAALCLSLMVYLTGIMLLIAKQGGIGPDVESFLFFSHRIRLWFQYRFVTFDQLGMWINLGRHAFPMVLLLMAEDRSMLQCIRKRPRLCPVADAALPAPDRAGSICRRSITRCLRSGRPGGP